MTDIDALEALAKSTVPGYALSASPVVILDLIAEVRALREDAERLNWIEERVLEGGLVWLDGCCETLCFLQVRNFGKCENYPSVEGLRSAIDAARKASQ